MILLHYIVFLCYVMVFMTAPIRFLIWDVLLSHTRGCQFVPYFLLVLKLALKTLPRKDARFDSLIR